MNKPQLLQMKEFNDTTSNLDEHLNAIEFFVLLTDKLAYWVLCLLALLALLGLGAMLVQ